jgi:hydrogenase maturation protein HypF
MSIFLSIASYCDPVLGFTLAHAVKTARWPDRLHFGIVDQSPANRPVVGHRAYEPARISFVRIEPEYARGPCWARAIAMSLYDGEDWFLQIDSHMDFDLHWDQRLVEHGEAGPALALALDGAGFGSDGHIWGGELLHVDAACCQRLAHLEHVPLPGGDAAAREPWRMAAAWLAIAFPEGAPRLAWHARRDPARLRAVEALVRHGATPLTSSCGRLFDAVASLLDAGTEASHEGEVAIALECLAARGRPGALAEPLAAAGGAGRCAPSAAPLVRAIVLARAAGAPREDLALAFHQGLAALLAAAAVRAAARTGARRVALTGGCFQNRLLLEAACARLADLGLAPLVHRHVPPSDGGLAVGQAAAAAARLLRA